MEEQAGTICRLEQGAGRKKEQTGKRSRKELYIEEQKETRSRQEEEAGAK